MKLRFVSFCFSFLFLLVCHYIIGRDKRPEAIHATGSGIYLDINKMLRFFAFVTLGRLGFISVTSLPVSYLASALTNVSYFAGRLQQRKPSRPMPSLKLFLILNCCLVEQFFY